MTGVCLEFGTRPLREVANALRGDHWLHLHPGTPAALQASIRHRLFEAFFVDTPEWKHNAVAEVHMAAAQALDGLGWAVEAAGGSALNMKIHRQMYR